MEQGFTSQGWLPGLPTSSESPPAHSKWVRSISSYDHEPSTGSCPVGHPASLKPNDAQCSPVEVIVSSFLLPIHSTVTHSHTHWTISAQRRCPPVDLPCLRHTLSCLVTNSTYCYSSHYFLLHLFSLIKRCLSCAQFELVRHQPAAKGEQAVLRTYFASLPVFAFFVAPRTASVSIVSLRFHDACVVP